MTERNVFVEPLKQSKDVSFVMFKDAINATAPMVLFSSTSN
jgi:hypothetical protein